MVLTMKGTIKVWFSLVCAANVAVAFPPEEEGVSSVVEFKEEDQSAQKILEALVCVHKWIEDTQKLRVLCRNIVNEMILKVWKHPSFLNQKTQEGLERMNKILEEPEFVQTFASLKEELKKNAESLKKTLEDPVVVCLRIGPNLEMMLYNKNGKEETNWFQKVTDYLRSLQKSMEKYVERVFDFETAFKEDEEELEELMLGMSSIIKHQINESIQYPGMEPLPFHPALSLSRFFHQHHKEDLPPMQRILLEQRALNEKLIEEEDYSSKLHRVIDEMCRKHQKKNLSEIEAKKKNEDSPSEALNALEFFAKCMEEARERRRCCVEKLQNAFKKMQCHSDFPNESSPESIEIIKKIYNALNLREDVSSLIDYLGESHEKFGVLLKEPLLESLWIDQGSKVIFDPQKSGEKGQEFERARDYLSLSQSELKKYIRGFFGLFTKIDDMDVEEGRGGSSGASTLLGSSEPQSLNPRDYLDELSKKFKDEEEKMNKVQINTTEQIKYYQEQSMGQMKKEMEDLHLNK